MTLDEVNESLSWYKEDESYIQLSARSKSVKNKDRPPILSDADLLEDILMNDCK